MNKFLDKICTPKIDVKSSASSLNSFGYLKSNSEISYDHKKYTFCNTGSLKLSCSNLSHIVFCPNKNTSNNAAKLKMSALGAGRKIPQVKERESDY